MIVSTARRLSASGPQFVEAVDIGRLEQVAEGDAPHLAVPWHTILTGPAARGSSPSGCYVVDDARASDFFRWNGPSRRAGSASRSRGDGRKSGAAVIDQRWRRNYPLTETICHPYTIHMDVIRMVEMADNVHQLRPKPSDTEKITINLGYVDLGHIDLMVEDGFYSNRTDFIRTAIRNQLERHADVVKQSTARKSLDLGLRNYSREDLEEARRAGRMLDINVLGLATIAPDVTPALARATIASVVVLGALHASPEVKAALADRTR